jgi:hypothetical protein
MQLYLTRLSVRKELVDARMGFNPQFTSAELNTFLDGLTKEQKRFLLLKEKEYKIFLAPLEDQKNNETGASVEAPETKKA